MNTKYNCSRPCVLCQTYYTEMCFTTKGDKDGYRKANLVYLVDEYNRLKFMIDNPYNLNDLADIIGRQAIIRRELTDRGFFKTKQKPKLYLFTWYDPSSDNGHNELYYITTDPEGYIKKELDPDGKLDVDYEEFKQEGYNIIIEPVTKD